MTGVALPMMDLVRAIEPLAPNFAGIKYTGLYTHPGFMDAMSVLAYKEGKYEVLSGREEMMLEALAVGIKGHVGSQFNFAGDLYNHIREAFEKEGLTKSSASMLRSTQMRAIDLIDRWAKVSTAHEGANAAKGLMTLAGVPVGDARLPTLPLDSQAKLELEGSLKAFCAEASTGSPPDSPPLRMCVH